MSPPQFAYTSIQHSGSNSRIFKEKKIIILNTSKQSIMFAKFSGFKNMTQLN